ncbi:unnamed protein product [Cutaneotrichosporon oleaginosum]
MDRKRVIRKLTEVADSTGEASRSAEDMPAYTHRLVKHLLGSVSPEWQLTTTEPSAAPVGEGDAGSSSSGPTPAVIAPPQTWNMPSAQQMIQETLWHPSIFQDVPTLRTPAQHHQCSTGNSAFHPPQPDPIPQPITSDVLFPAADDDICAATQRRNRPTPTLAAGPIHPALPTSLNLISSPMLSHVSRATRVSRSVPRSLARPLSTSRPAAMPLYICYCPDYPDNLQTRLGVRDAHLAAAAEDKKTGASGGLRSCCLDADARFVFRPLQQPADSLHPLPPSPSSPRSPPSLAYSPLPTTTLPPFRAPPVFGRAFLDDSVATKEAGKPADQLPGMAGSVMILRFPTIGEAWARIKADKYWTGGVWDKDKVVVREIIGAPVDDTIKIQ